MFGVRNRYPYNLRNLLLQLVISISISREAAGHGGFPGASTGDDSHGGVTWWSLTQRRSETTASVWKRCADIVGAWLCISFVLSNIFQNNRFWTPTFAKSAAQHRSSRKIRAKPVQNGRKRSCNRFPHPKTSEIITAKSFKNG